MHNFYKLSANFKYVFTLFWSSLPPLPPLSNFMPSIFLLICRVQFVRLSTGVYSNNLGSLYERNVSLIPPVPANCQEEICETCSLSYWNVDYLILFKSCVGNNSSYEFMGTATLSSPTDSFSLILPLFWLSQLPILSSTTICKSLGPGCDVNIHL